LIQSLFFLLLLFNFTEAKHCLFDPPSGWEIAQLKNPSPHVKVSFLGKSSKEFHPSINLAIEEVDVSLKEYVKAVKELQSADPKIKWRDLGALSMEAGEGRLTEMSSASHWGDIKILQAFLVEGTFAYILTAAVLKEDFFKFKNEILRSFQSLKVIPDLWTPIADTEKQTEFAEFFTSLGSSDEKDLEWQKLQTVVGSHLNLGPYWQFLALQEGHFKIYGKGSK
jgi:hypothetical protein